MKLRTLALCSSIPLLCSCASMNQIGEETGDSAGVGNAIVIDDESFASGRGGVVSIIQNHVRGMNVTRGDVCPHLVLRGGGARSQSSEALVYVDGQRLSDTCVLEALNVESIFRVEVYPGGVTQRPGYSSNSGGLILVFMKNGTEARLWQ